MLFPRRAASAASALAIVGCFLIAAPAAHAQAMPQPLAPWSGANPFNCELHDVGFGVDYPDPGADPLCVKFDKTEQNVTDFGLVDFLANEPARVAAALPKCFYFQQDHWTGSIVQDEAPELWHWRGKYFFDRAKGIGGVSVRDFRIGGVPFDATPYVPEAYLPYFDATGGGGAITQLEIPIDPVCGAMVDTPRERAQIYGKSGVVARCVAPGGRATARAIGEARLGMTRAKLRDLLGRPRARSKRADSWCVIGGASLRVAYHRNRAVAIRTNNRGQRLAGIRRGDSKRKAVRNGGDAYFRVGRHVVLFDNSVWPVPSRAIFGAVGGRVRWIGLVSKEIDAGLIRSSIEATFGIG
jgi:hypothetical protein